jgi:D-galactarolactone isomerase
MSTGSHRIDESAPRLQAPPGACDSHIHFYGPPERYPLAPTATFTPPPASVDAYRQVQQQLGLQRVVVVQPSAYGFDNRCTLDAVRQIGEAARAVVVVEPAISGEELQRLTNAGVRAVRFFMFPGGVLSWDDLDQLAGRVGEFGWHVQLQLDGRQLPDCIDRLRSLPAKLQIDHTGKFIEPVSTGDRAFRMLLDLVDRGRCWVKLAAPYETSKIGPPLYGDVGKLAKALVRAAPERMLWASNWPHPSAQGNPPDNAMLLDLLLDWADDDTTRKRILVDNPAALYGFS